MNQGYYNNGNYNNRYNNNYNGNYNRPYYPNYNYNYQNNGNNMMNNNNDNKDDKKSLFPLLIVIAILFIIVISLIVILMLPAKKVENTTNTENTETAKQEEIDKSDITIGDASFGYMKIPYSYKKSDDSTATLLKYYSSDKRYSVKMMITKDEGKGAYNYTKAYVERLKANNATDIKQAQITIQEQEAYQVYAITEEGNTLLAICLKSGDNIRFVVIEGPDGTNIVFKSLENYKI